MRPFFSQSPYRVGSGPFCPPNSVGWVSGFSAVRRAAASAAARSPASRTRAAISFAFVILLDGMASHHTSGARRTGLNIVRTGILMALLTGLFLVVGFLIGGPTGMLIAFLFAAGTNLWAYWNSDKALLSMYGARLVDGQSAPQVVNLVRQLSGQAGLPVPKVYIVENDQPNAFATGRDPEHAAVCVTSGLLARVNNEELAGVLAHELGHVKHRDTLTMTIVAVMAGAISMLANMAFFMGGGRDRNNPLGIVGVILVTLLVPILASL